MHVVSNVLKLGAHSHTLTPVRRKRHIQFLTSAPNFRGSTDRPPPDPAYPSPWSDRHPENFIDEFDDVHASCSSVHRLVTQTLRENLTKVINRGTHRNTRPFANSEVSEQRSLQKIEQIVIALRVKTHGVENRRRFSTPCVFTLRCQFPLASI